MRQVFAALAMAPPIGGDGRTAHAAPGRRAARASARANPGPGPAAARADHVSAGPSRLVVPRGRRKRGSARPMTKPRIAANSSAKISGVSVVVKKKSTDDLLGVLEDEDRRQDDRADRDVEPPARRSAGRCLAWFRLTRRRDPSTGSDRHRRRNRDALRPPVSRRASAGSPGVRSERGQATVEWVGLLLLATLVLAAVLVTVGWRAVRASLRDAVLANLVCAVSLHRGLPRGAEAAPRTTGTRSAALRPRQRPGPALRGRDDRDAGRLPPLPHRPVRGGAGGGDACCGPSAASGSSPSPTSIDCRERRAGRRRRRLLGRARRQPLPPVLVLLPGLRHRRGQHAAEGRDPQGRARGRQADATTGTTGSPSRSGSSPTAAASPAPARTTATAPRLGPRAATASTSPAAATPASAEARDGRARDQGRPAAS